MTEGSRFFSWFRDNKDQKTVPPKHPETKPLQASEDITDKEKGPSTETRETSGKYDHPFLNNGSNSDILVAYRKQIEDIDIHLTSHELNKNQREGLRFDRQILGRRIQYLELIDKQMRVFEEEVQEDKRPNYFNHQPDWLEFYGGYEKGIEEKELKSFQQNKRKRNNERRSLNGFDWDSRIKEPKEIIKKIEEHLNLSTDPSFIPGFPKHLKNKLRSYHPAYGTRATFVSDKIVFLTHNITIILIPITDHTDNTLFYFTQEKMRF